MNRTLIILLHACIITYSTPIFSTHPIHHPVKSIHGMVATQEALADEH